MKDYRKTQTGWIEELPIQLTEQERFIHLIPETEENKDIYDAYKQKVLVDRFIEVKDDTIKNILDTTYDLHKPEGDFTLMAAHFCLEEGNEPRGIINVYYGEPGEFVKGKQIRFYDGIVSVMEH
jgi:hypothetical protein